MWEILIPAAVALGTGLGGFLLGRKTVAGKPPSTLEAWREIDRQNKALAREQRERDNATRP